MPRDESEDVGVYKDNGTICSCRDWEDLQYSGDGDHDRYVPHSHLPQPCSTCRHRMVNNTLRYCTKIFRDTPDDGYCYLHEPLLANEEPSE
jgi:hypothetical protein